MKAKNVFKSKDPKELIGKYFVSTGGGHHPAIIKIIGLKENNFKIKWI